MSSDGVYPCEYDVSGIKGAEEHIIDHILTGDYFSEFENKKYVVYEVIPYKKDCDLAAAFRSDFIRYQEFINVIFKDIRCVLASKGYENLETPLSEGIIDSHRNNYGKAIEMMLDDNIRNQLAIVLMSQFYVPNAHVIIDEIIKTENYKKNVNFIKKYHERMKHDISDEVIEERYKGLVSELLLLLEREEYKEHLQKNISFYNMDVIRNRMVTREFDYFSKYSIRR